MLSSCNSIIYLLNITRYSFRSKTTIKNNKNNENTINNNKNKQNKKKKKKLLALYNFMKNKKKVDFCLCFIFCLEKIIMSTSVYFNLTNSSIDSHDNLFAVGAETAAFNRNVLYKCCMAFLMGLFSLTAICGNALVIVAMIREKLLRKTVTNFI